MYVKKGCFESVWENSWIYVFYSVYNQSQCDQNSDQAQLDRLRCLWRHFSLIEPLVQILTYYLAACERIMFFYWLFYIYIVIYAFARHFCFKWCRLKLFFCFNLCNSCMGIEPMILATTMLYFELHENLIAQLPVSVITRRPYRYKFCPYHSTFSFSVHFSSPAVVHQSQYCKVYNYAFT